MNTAAVREALVAHLAADAELTAILAPEASLPGMPPAIFQGVQQAAPAVYPCLTYRLSAITPDARFRPTPVEVSGIPKSGESPLVEYRLEIEAWSRDGYDGASALGDRVVALLEGQRIALPGGVGAIYRSELTTRLTDRYSAVNSIYFELLRFLLRVSF